MAWVAAGDGYEVALADGKVLCRGAGTGKVLKAVPKAVRETDAVAGLRQLREWLDRHDDACLRQVEDWMVRSLPVPAKVIAAVWPDQSWRSVLNDLVVTPVGKAGGWRLDAGGFLRDVDETGRLGTVNLDGESVWLAVDRVVLPHPVLLDDLDELREFAVELGVRQGVLQLFREVWRKPDRPDEMAKEAAAYAGGRFAQLRHLTGRATSLGYAVRGGYAVSRMWEHGQAVEACVWAGAGDPSVEAETGELAFVRADGTQLTPAEVGPVAWSEGMRMAAALYAGRMVEQDAAA
jgi:Domain of unknown function (DUF4132)